MRKLSVILKFCISISDLKNEVNFDLEELHYWSIKAGPLDLSSSFSDI